MLQKTPVIGRLDPTVGRRLRFPGARRDVRSHYGRKGQRYREDDADGVIAFGLSEIIHELATELEAKGVALLRTVQGDASDGGLRSRT